MELNSIYSTLPEQDSTTQEQRQAILSFLQAYPRKFFTAKEIASSTGFSTKQTCPALRQAITELIHFDQAPIVANHAGFAWTDQPGMIRRYLEHLTHRRQGLDRRIRDLQAVLQQMTTGQLEDYTIGESKII